MQSFSGQYAMVTALPLQVTPSDIRDMVRSRDLRVGDVMIVHGPMEALRWIISRTQKRLLDDLYTDPPLDKEMRDWHAEGSHALFVESENTFAEMYRPSARRRTWSEIPENTVLVVKRLKALSPVLEITSLFMEEKYKLILKKIEKDITDKFGYSMLELIRFYCYSWRIRKIFLGNHFKNVFVQDSRDSCASWCMSVFNSVGLTSEPPEAWYPARISSDTSLFYSPLGQTIQRI